MYWSHSDAPGVFFLIRNFIIWPSPRSKPNPMPSAPSNTPAISINNLKCVKLSATSNPLIQILRMREHPKPYQVQIPQPRKERFRILTLITQRQTLIHPYTKLHKLTHRQGSQHRHFESHPHARKPQGYRHSGLPVYIQGFQCDPGQVEYL